MIEKYDVFLNDHIVGQVSMRKEKLYYLIRCKCCFVLPGIYKISVTGSNGTVNLGTCIPVKDGYTLETRIPVKSIGEKGIEFKVLCPDGGDNLNAVSVTDHQPFRYLYRLRGSTLVKQNGVNKIVLKDSCYSGKEMVKPTGQ